jgi:hypothetical protein
VKYKLPGVRIALSW